MEKDCNTTYLFYITYSNAFDDLKEQTGSSQGGITKQ